ncbi:hypothetical protein VUR80DRAFT_10223 [Thermomyces stellatus]
MGVSVGCFARVKGRRRYEGELGYGGCRASPFPWAGLYDSVMRYSVQYDIGYHCHRVYQCRQDQRELKGTRDSYLARLCLPWLTRAQASYAP